MQSSYLDAVQGSSEARTKAYIQYAEGALQVLTPQRTKSTGKVCGFATNWDSTLRSLH